MMVPVVSDSADNHILILGLSDNVSPNDAAVYAMI